MSERELRARVNELALRISGDLEQEAGIIFNQDSDPALRRRAIFMAIRVNEILVRATGHRDALVAFLDVWTFTAQLCNFFETGAGSDLFGESQAIAIEAARRAEADAAALANEISVLLVGDAQQRFADWVLANPMAGGLYRPTIGPLAAQVTTDRGKSIFSAAETLEEGLDRVSQRIDILNSQLPKQLLWRAGVLTEFKLEQALAVTRDLPALVQEQRDLVIQEVDRQRTDTLRAIDAQRVATIAALDNALETAVGAIDLERVETFKNIETMMDATFVRIEEQRNRTIEDVQVLLTGMVKDAEVNAESVVDYIFWRSLLLIGAGFLGGLVLVVVLRVAKRPA
ncbi:MAG: hypothetical protein ACYSU7_16980 [Planctomycetota bacterium]